MTHEQCRTGSAIVRGTGIDSDRPTDRTPVPKGGSDVPTGCSYSQTASFGAIGVAAKPVKFGGGANEPGP
jgi:hypothetical protein